MSRFSSELKPSFSSALSSIMAQPGIVLFSLLRRMIFFNRANLAAWCLDIRQGRARPALLKGRYFLLPLIYLVESFFPDTVDSGVGKTVYRILIVDKSTKSVVRKTARF